MGVARAYRFNRFTLDLAQGRLLRDGSEVHLRPKSLSTLAHLVENSGRLLTKEELLRAIWPDSFVTDESLVKCINDVRTALDDADHLLVETVPRRGYLFRGAVERTTYTVAVLPFRTSAGVDDYLGLGIADALITRFSRLRRVAVRPTSVVLKYASAGGIDPVSIGTELGVDFVVEGSLYRSANGIRITAQLVHVRDASTAWADAFDSSSGDVLALQDAVAQRIALAAFSSITGDERSTLTRRYTEDPVAHQLYLKGRYCWSHASEGYMRKAIGFFEQATQRDPRYALAYSGIADAYLVLAAFVVGALRPMEAYPLAKAAALEAVRLDDRLPEAHTSLAAVSKVFDWNWLEAEKGFRRAIELDHSYATAHQWYAMLLAAQGRLPEALREIKEAHGLDPVSTAIARDMGRVYFFTREFDLAIAELEQALALEPNVPTSLLFLGMACAQVGRYEDSLRALRQAVDNTRRAPHMLAALAHTCAIAGDASEAVTILQELKIRSASAYVSAYNLAIVHAGLGETDSAIEYLERTYEEHSNWLVFLRGEPRLDNLRGDARFADIVRRVGVAEYSV